LWHRVKVDAATVLLIGHELFSPLRGEGAEQFKKKGRYEGFLPV